MTWPMVKIGDIFEVARGGSPRPIDEFITDSPDGVNWVSIRDASNSSKYITKTEKKILTSGVSKSRMVKPGDFLLTNSMSFGRPYIMKTSGCIHDGWLVLSSDSGVVDQDFFYHLLGSELIYKKFRGLAAGAVVKNLNIDLVKTVSIPLPPLFEQRRMASILDKADALRTKRREAIAKLDQLLQSVFLNMFGDPVMNPKGWLVTSIGSNCEKLTVGIVVKPASYYVEAGVPAIRSLNIGVNKIVERDFVYFSEKDNIGVLKNTVLKTGDVVAVRSGQPGKAAVIPPNLDGANAIDVLIARTRKDRLLPEFLVHFLNSSAGKRLVLSQQRGQVQKHLNVKQLSSAVMPLPPIEAQRNFLNSASSIEAVRAKMLQASFRLDEYFESIQKRAFAGKL